MPPPAELAPEDEAARQSALRLRLNQERRSQLRGLLLIALAALLFILYRAQPLHLFQPDWWRP